MVGESSLVSNAAVRKTRQAHAGRVFSFYAVCIAYAGVYEIDGEPKFSLDIRLEKERLVVHSPNRPRYQLFPESEEKFFAKVISTEFEFLKDDSGRVAHLVLRYRGGETRGERKQ